MIAEHWPQRFDTECEWWQDRGDHRFEDFLGAGWQHARWSIPCAPASAHEGPAEGRLRHEGGRDLLSPIRFFPHAGAEAPEILAMIQA